MRFGGRRTFVAIALGIGVVIGAGAVISNTFVNDVTSTAEFCATCHSMSAIARDDHFLTSAHISNDKGVVVGCADCHIPEGNIFTETYTHVAQGVRDIIAEQTHDFSDPAIWEARRIELAHEVRALMRSEDSATCRSCHDPAKIRPSGPGGQAAHRLLQSQNLTCIDCHFNLVHGPVAPAMSFIRGSGLGSDRAPEN